MANFLVVGHPDEIEWRDDDIILLTMKSNDTESALRALADAGVVAQQVVCAQNGVANEFMALRYFKNVVAMVVLMPAEYLEAGTVVASGSPKFGVLDLGIFPADSTNTKPVPDKLVESLTAAGFICAVRDDVMAGKYGKLLQNMGNMIEAALGKEARYGSWNDLARIEGEAVLKAAGIEFYAVDKGNPQLKHTKLGHIPGFTRVGSSSMQSLIRGTGSIETDFLNGEIVMLGRLHNVDTPVNAAFARAARLMIRDGIAPGDFPEADIERFVSES